MAAASAVLDLVAVVVPVITKLVGFLGDALTTSSQLIPEPTTTALIS